MIQFQKRTVSETGFSALGFTVPSAVTNTKTPFQIVGFGDERNWSLQLAAYAEDAISDASQGSLPATGQALPGGLVPAGFQLRLSFAYSLSLSFRCWLERHPVSSDFCWRQRNWILRDWGRCRFRPHRPNLRTLEPEVLLRPIGG